jgi:predicted RNase H-like nuclease (RuvC/YqgF family)
MDTINTQMNTLVETQSEEIKELKKEIELYEERISRMNAIVKEAFLKNHADLAVFIKLNTTIEDKDDEIQKLKIEIEDKDKEIKTLNDVIRNHLQDLHVNQFTKFAQKEILQKEILKYKK